MVSALEKSTVVYRSVAGHDIHADVFRPAGSHACPVIAYFHGGALIGGSRELKPDLLPVRRLFELAERQGYAFVSFDYRLAPETKLTDIVGDVEAAFAWLDTEGSRHFDLDPRRIVAAGESAGGYLALLSGYRASPRPKAIVSLYGYGMLDAPWYTSPNPYPAYSRTKIVAEDVAGFRGGEVVSDSRLRTSTNDEAYRYYLYLRQHGLWLDEVGGGLSAQGGLAAYEPARNVSPHFPATLLIHGRMDSDVPYAESAGMARQFDRHGVPYIFKSIDDAEHGLVGGNPEALEQAFATMAAFVGRYLDPKDA